MVGTERYKVANVRCEKREMSKNGETISRYETEQNEGIQTNTFEMIPASAVSFSLYRLFQRPIYYCADKLTFINNSPCKHFLKCCLQCIQPELIFLGYLFIFAEPFLPSLQ